jgi:hypothetical protein
MRSGVGMFTASMDLSWNIAKSVMPLALSARRVHRDRGR